MSESVTIARPYAKAVFNHALAGHKMKEWSQCLQSLAAVVMDSAAATFISNPATSVTQHCDLLVSLLPRVDHNMEKSVRNFVETLACNKRVLTLPDIMILYEAMRAEQEKTMIVHVSSATPLSKGQQQRLIEALGKRLQRQEVTLDVTIDEELVGGAVIQAGDLVIDGSVRGKINKLRTGLVA